MKDKSNVIVFDDLDRYSQVFVKPEKPVSLARGLFQKLIKKKFDFLPYKVVKFGGFLSIFWKIQFDALKEKLFAVREWLIGPKENEAKESNEQVVRIKRDLTENMFNVINHMGDLRPYQERKFMFLKKALHNTRIMVPPLSTYNIPNMIMVDFNSPRFTLKNESFSFQVSNSSADFLNRFDTPMEKAKVNHGNMNEKEIEDMLDDMVLVMKNNLTGLSIIPVK